MTAESVRLAPGHRRTTHRIGRGWARRALIRLLAAAVLAATGYLVARGLVFAGVGGPVLFAVAAVLVADALISWFVIESNQRRERALARLLAERPPPR